MESPKHGIANYYTWIVVSYAKGDVSEVFK